VSQEVADRVLQRLTEKGYVDDGKFTQYWVENRNQRQGISLRKLRAELQTKGIAGDVIEENIQKSTRDEKSEIQKIIAKKASKYHDEQKLMAYLARQGFSYDVIQSALADQDKDS
jgi:regulatory protein